MAAGARDVLVSFERRAGNAPQPAAEAADPPVAGFYNGAEHDAGRGDGDQDWPELAQAWAHVRDLSGRELEIAGQETSEGRVVVEALQFQELQGLNPSDRVRIMTGSRAGQVYGIDHVGDPSGRERKMTIRCTKYDTREPI